MGSCHDTNKRREQINFSFQKFRSIQCPAFVDVRVYTSEHRISNHCHDFPQIWYCRSGVYEHWVAEQKHVCKKGAILVIPAGKHHYFRIPQGEEAEVLCLNIKPDLFLGMPIERFDSARANLFLTAFVEELEYELPSYLELSATSQQGLDETVSALAMLTYSPADTVKKEDICQLLEDIFSLPELALPSAYREKARRLFQTRAQPILQIMSYLGNHYPEKISEEDLIREGGISRAVLYRYFKRVTGFTYSYYLQQFRVGWADVYLRYTTYSLTYIADLCGFCDTSHMSNRFTRFVGSSPKQKREEIKRLAEETK